MPIITAHREQENMGPSTSPCLKCVHYLTCLWGIAEEPNFSIEENKNAQRTDQQKSDEGYTQHNLNVVLAQ